MKLLLDENLSPTLLPKLLSDFPDSGHVEAFGLRQTDDAFVWDFAKRNGFVIVTKDRDFNVRSLLYGHPPKVVWVRLGNCSTAQVLRILLTNRPQLESFFANPLQGLLLIS